MMMEDLEENCFAVTVIQLPWLALGWKLAIAAQANCQLMQVPAWRSNIGILQTPARGPHRMIELFRKGQHQLASTTLAPLLARFSATGFLEASSILLYIPTKIHHQVTLRRRFPAETFSL
jgi:hypothetical protein